MKNFDNLNYLMDVALSYGCDFLEKGKILYPYLFTIDKKGNLNRANDLTESEKIMDIQDLISSFKITLKKQIKKNLFCGFALGNNVKVQRFKNENFIRAIEIHIEHKNLDKAYFGYLPYTKNDNNTITFNQIFSQKKAKKLF